MKPSLAIETELSHDSVLGIMDFRYAPYALGDTFTWITNLQIVAETRQRPHIDIALMTLPEMPSSRLQRHITAYNYTNVVEGLFPAFLCCPRLRSLRIHEKFATSAQQILGAMHARSASWPGFIAHFRKELDYSTHRRINAFHAAHGSVPTLRPPPGFEAETEELKRRHLRGRSPYIVNIRQRGLTADPAALHRDSTLDAWRGFLTAVEEKYPSAVFVLVGGVSEWDRSIARRRNVVIPRMLGFGLGHELTLLLGGTPFIGSSSGFSAAATFSRTPYQITNFEHQAAAYIDLPVGTERYPFATDRQWLCWKPETCDHLLTLFERLYQSSTEKGPVS